MSTPMEHIGDGLDEGDVIVGELLDFGGVHAEHAPRVGFGADEDTDPGLDAVALQHFGALEAGLVRQIRHDDRLSGAEGVAALARAAVRDAGNIHLRITKAALCDH